MCFFDGWKNFPGREEHFFLPVNLSLSLNYIESSLIINIGGLILIISSLTIMIVIMPNCHVDGDEDQKLCPAGNHFTGSLPGNFSHEAEFQSTELVSLSCHVVFTITGTSTNYDAFTRGKEMSVSRDLDLYYKLPQIRPECCLFAPKCSNAVY